MLQLKQTVSQDLLFHNDLFKKTCQKIHTRNKVMIIQNISLLIVSFIQTLAIYSATHLNHLYESINEDWNSTISLYNTYSQFNYSVGFRYSVFTEKHFKKLKLFIGEIRFKLQIYFMVTIWMYFPFLICKVKCSIVTLNITDY